MAEAASIEIISALGDYLSQRMRFKQTILGWPESSQKLSLPACSIIVKREKLIPHPPHLLNVNNISGNKGDSVYVTGEYEFSLQLDLWCKTSAERYDAKERLTQIFHSQDERVVPILRLVLPKYHKISAIYTLLGCSIPDSAATPLAQEWRVLVDITVSCSQIIVRDNEALITQTPDVDLEIIK